MANDIGTQKYDYAGMAEGTLLGSNDIGTQKYDYAGEAEGGIGTSGTLPRRTLLGVGL